MQNPSTDLKEPENGNSFPQTEKSSIRKAFPRSLGERHHSFFPTSEQFYGRKKLLFSFFLSLFTLGGGGPG